VGSVSAAIRDSQAADAVPVIEMRHANCEA